MTIHLNQTNIEHLLRGGVLEIATTDIEISLDPRERQRLENDRPKIEYTQGAPRPYAVPVFPV